MAHKTTINFDDEMQDALDELVELDGTKKLAIKKSLLAEVKRRRQSRELLDWIEALEVADGPIDKKHMDWAHKMLDRQGVPK